MLQRLKIRFSAKIVFLISLVFLIPIITSLITLKITSNASIERFNEVLSRPVEVQRSFIKEIFPKSKPDEVEDLEGIVTLLRDYEHRRTFGLFMSLIVISFALAAVVILLSMLILKRGMLSLHELSAAAAQVGEGDLDVQVEPRSHDEFSELIRTFKMMTGRLKETMVTRDFYNHVIESMPAAVLTLDNESRITTWNRQAETLTGIGSAEAVGRPISEFANVLGPATSPDDLPFYGRELVLRLKGGGQRMISKGADRLFDRGGRPSGMIETFTDITAQKKLERELVIAKERAEESSRLRSEFLANMSHEIRTPLNGILGLAELLAEEEKNGERRGNLMTIKQCGQSLLHLINEILELSKLEAGRMVLHPATVPTMDVVREATSTIEVGCKKKGLELSVEVEECVPETIEIDNHKLAQILINLLGNALKFTEKGGIKLRVGSYRGTRPGDLVFSVIDTGCGIARDRQQRIFESFVQAEGYLTRRSDGTGLGLAIAKKLVSLMGGEIWIESEEGRGSTFSFTIESAP